MGKVAYNRWLTHSFEIFVLKTIEIKMQFVFPRRIVLQKSCKERCKIDEISLIIRATFLETAGLYIFHKHVK